MQGKLHFILQIEVSVWHEREQSRQVGEKLIPQLFLPLIVSLLRTLYLEALSLE